MTRGGFSVLHSRRAPALLFFCRNLRLITVYTRGSNFFEPTKPPEFKHGFHQMSVINTSPPLDWHVATFMIKYWGFFQLPCNLRCISGLTCSAILCWIPLPSASRLFSSVLNDPRGANSKMSAQGFTHAPTMLIILGWWRLRRNKTSWRNKRYGWFSFLGWNTYKTMAQLSVMKPMKSVHLFQEQQCKRQEFCSNVFQLCWG